MAGDSLDFYLIVLTTGNTWFSNTPLNTGGANHVYSASFAATGIMPRVTYVWFEDLAANVADFNYTDEQFVFINTTITSATAMGAALRNAVRCRREWQLAVAELLF